MPVMEKQKTTGVQVGDKMVGGGAPVLVNPHEANTPTEDTS